MDVTFGPVPSRRLGRSLGVNNIPYKVCTYACVYCQIGRTLRMEIDRKKFYSPDMVIKEVGERINRAEKRGERIDFVTFVPDGEPTLDINVGMEAKKIRDFGYPVAILTNASLMWREDVRKDLFNFDYVSVKVDAVTESVWKKIDRPHKDLRLDMILNGLIEFSEEYAGTLVTETMLIGGIDYSDELNKIGEFLSRINPDISYIGIPTRPPAERWVGVPEEDLIAQAYHEFKNWIDRVEYLIGYEGSDFVSTGNLEEDILSITAVHPMRREAMEKLINRNKSSWDVVEGLVEKGELKEVNYEGIVYYIRKFRDGDH